MVSIEEIKKLAKQMKAELKACNVEMPYTSCLQMVSKNLGFRNWQTASGMLKDKE